MNTRKLCSIDGCGKPFQARGLCQAHYRKWSLYGDPRADHRPKAQFMCSVEGCGPATKIRKGLCPKHYSKLTEYGDPEAGKQNAPHRSKVDFAEAAAKFDGGECLPWPFATNSNGYGTLKYQGRQIVASRLVCLLANGEPPRPFYQAAHSCGKGHLGCVNPKHLSWKTPSGNTLDKRKHGTMLQGEKHPNAKLTAEDVEVVRLLASEMNHTDIGRLFGVRGGTIGDILAGRKWNAGGIGK